MTLNFPKEKTVKVELKGETKTRKMGAVRVVWRADTNHEMTKLPSAAFCVVQFE